MKLRGAILAVLSLGLILAPVSHADSPRGLGISPIRQEVSVDAGKSSSKFFTVTNDTNTTVTVRVSFKQFSVANYTYDYSFDTPKQDWIKFVSDSITLSAGQSKQVIYDIETPRSAAPGGYYFSLIASTTVANGSVPTTVEASTLLYLTVRGNLVRTSVIQNSSVPWLINDSRIPYKFDVTDTGNVHFTANFFGRVESIFGSSANVGVSHVLLPGAVRTINNTIPSPTLPGVYRVVYGYEPDFAKFEVTQSAYILYLPPWSIVLLILLFLSAVWYVQNRALNKQRESNN